jgi:hypothetical protein
MKYTKELLEPIVRESKSFAEVLRRLGVRWNGGTQANLVRRIKLHELDTSHFLGQKRNRGVEHKGGNQKLHWAEILVIDRRKINRKERVFRLREAMIESGIPYVCGTCGAPPEWMGKPLVLQIDHKNGNNLDNRPNNVRFGCPNCHSQTETFGAKNIGRMA